MGSYILSKLVVLAALCLLQSLLATGVFALLVGLPEAGVMTAPRQKHIIAIPPNKKETPETIMVSGVLHGGRYRT